MMLSCFYQDTSTLTCDFIALKKKEIMLHIPQVHFIIVNADITV